MLIGEYILILIAVIGIATFIVSMMYIIITFIMYCLDEDHISFMIGVFGIIGLIVVLIGVILINLNI